MVGGSGGGGGGIIKQFVEDPPRKTQLCVKEEYNSMFNAVFTILILMSKSR